MPSTCVLFLNLLNFLFHLHLIFRVSDKVIAERTPASYPDMDPSPIACLYYAVTAVCSDTYGNEVEYKRVKPTQPMVYVSDYTTVGEPISLHASEDSGRPGHPAVSLCHSSNAKRNGCSRTEFTSQTFYIVFPAHFGVLKFKNLLKPKKQCW